MSGKVGDAREVALNVLRQMFDEGANIMFDTTHDRELALEMLRRGLSASPQDGWVLVPKEPTPAMLHAGFGTADDDNAWRWKAMVEAARVGT